MGKVIYLGTLPRVGDGPEEHNWEIKTGGISLDKGGDPNPISRTATPARSTSERKSVQPSSSTGAFDMEAFLTSINGKTCNATGHIIFVGPFPLFTLVGGFATFFGAMGILGLLFNSRPAITWRA